MTAKMRRLADESTVVALIRTLVRRVQVWIANSWLVTKGTTFTNTLEITPILGRVWRGSLARRATKRLRITSNGAWVTESRTVRLLAAALESPEGRDQE